MKNLFATAALLCLFLPAFAQSRLLKGIVLDDSSGAPLSGVNVTVKGGRAGTQSDAKGAFVISIPSSGKVELVFSSVGYKTHTVSSGDQELLTVRLGKDVNALDDVIVIGYGTVRKKDLTGAVSSVKTADILKTPVVNAMEAIQGKIPGADITRSSGASTSGVSITIRGNRSIGASNSPLYIIDGMQTGDISDLNPNDIESIDFLKDASSTAIYGYLGANGIVIITTKRGVAGKTRVSFNANYGVNQLSRYPKVMDGPAYIALRRQAWRTTGDWASDADDSKIFTAPQLAAVQNKQYLDYQDLLIHNGSQQDYQLSVTSGSEKSRVYFSLDYYNEKGLFLLDYNKRYSARLNFDQTVSKFFRVGIQSQVTYYDQSFRRDPLNQANKVAPLGSIYDSSGSFIQYPMSGTFVNPLADEQPDVYKNSNIQTNVVSNAYVEVKPVTGLTFRSSIGTNLSFARNGIFAASTSLDRNGAASQAKEINWNNRYINWDNVLTWQKLVGDHSLTVTALTSYIQSVADTTSAQGEGQLLPSQLFYALGNASSNIAIYSNYAKWNSMSYAGRLNYSFKGKYLFTFTDRFDGASRLAAGHKWTSFPSGAVAWRLSEEDFLRGVKPITDLKVRVSYGVSGNSAIPVYGTQSSLTKIPFAYGETSASGYTFSPTIGNLDAGWELSSTLDLGVDVSLLNSRVNATFDWYDTHTKDLLLPRGLPPSDGVTRIYENIGKTRNKGIELAINTVNVRSRSFTWSSTFTFSRNKERIESLVTNNQNDIGNGWFIGQPIKVFYDYKKLGIWQTDEATQAAAYNLKPGDIKIADIDTNKVFDATHDRTILGTPRPSWIGSLENSFKYKNFDVSFSVFARWGQMIHPDFLSSRYDPQGVENSYAGIDYWTPENPTNDYPRPNKSTSLKTMPFYSSLGYVNGSYMRLRSATIGYNLPASVLNKTFVQGLRIYVSGRNLLTWTKSSALKNFDPERSDGSETFPMTKSIVFGLNVNF